MENGATSLLVLGGARSGKSRYAQARAEAADAELVFIATAQAFDDEMHQRILRHREDRGPRWRTVEEPIALADAILAHSNPKTVVLVDCLTLWASNLLLADHDLDRAGQDIARAIALASGPLIIVSNEVGLGIVPDNPLARRFRDAAGMLNQIVAATVTEAVMMFSGLPLHIKGAEVTR